MKLFYKKDYLEKVLEVAKLDKQVKEKNLFIAQLKDNLNYKKELLERETRVSNELNEELLKSSEELKKVLGAKGGLAKENNKLKNIVEELKKEKQDLKIKLEESMTDKYLVKKIPSGKTPNTIKTKVSSPMKSSVRKYMREEFES